MVYKQSKDGTIIGKFLKHLYTVKKISRRNAIQFVESIGSKNSVGYVGNFYKKVSTYSKYTYISEDLLICLKD